MQLVEGAKISQQILRQAINDPDFTFGIEAEFFLVGAAEFFQQYMTQGLETMDTGTPDRNDFYVKKLGDLTWHDVSLFFEPLGIHQGDNRPSYMLMRDRLEKLYKRHTEDDTDQKTPPDMWDILKETMGVPVLMAALQVFPDGRLVGLPKGQNDAFRDMVYDGATDEVKPFGKLRDVPVALGEVGHEDESYDMEDSKTTETFYALVAKDLSAKLGVEVKYVWNDSMVYHVGAYKSWVVTSDDSLELYQRRNPSFENVVGVEVVSPIMNAKEGLVMLDRMLEIMNGQILGLDVVTTEGTGLHINLGVKGKDIDPVKILVLSGDKHMLDKFNRADSEYASSVQDSLKDRMATVAKGELPNGVDASTYGLRKDVDTLVARAQGALRGIDTDERDIDRVIAVLNNLKPEGKIHSINFEKLPSGYVEYRAIGNAGYEKRQGEIRDAVLHMIGMTYVATEPSAYRQEFLKKLYSMVQNTNTKEPIAASVGMIGYGPRGGYGAPIENEPKTPYDGEEFLTKYGFDPGSDTQ